VLMWRFLTRHVFTLININEIIEIWL
jgi:hypothetical protein